jgi:hypothetical protein
MKNLNKIHSFTIKNINVQFSKRTTRPPLQTINDLVPEDSVSVSHHLQFIAKCTFTSSNDTQKLIPRFQLCMSTVREFLQKPRTYLELCTAFPFLDTFHSLSTCFSSLLKKTGMYGM